MELKKILKLHKLWLEGKKGGVRANLAGVSFDEADKVKLRIKGKK